MPQIVFDPLGGLNSFLRQMPIPTLNSYITLSIILTSVLFYHVHNLFLDKEFDDMVKAHIANQTQSGRLSEFGKLFDSSLTFRKLHYAVNHPALIWVGFNSEVVLNSVCASLAILAKAAVHFTFGQLGAQESELLRDRLCNFLLYKAVFLFGVLNNMLFDEVILWILWFTFVSMFTLLQILTMHRFKYFTSSLPPNFVQLHVLILNIFALVASVVLVIIALSSFRFLSTSYALFLLADVRIASKLFFRGLYLTVKSVILLNEAHPVLPLINSITFVYYVDLAHDLITDAIDLLHYTHMLLYTQIVLSMACIVLFMQLRAFYKSLSSRINRHLKYKLISSHINSSYPAATKEELDVMEDFCAICWERMQSARRCLRSWLEQDSSCPTCRMVLASPTDAAASSTDDSAQTVNHVFRFDGTRYSSWLPRFSFELLHNVGSNSFQRNRAPVFDTSQLNLMANQVHEMFPQLGVETILQDIRESGSTQATIENILEGRLEEYNSSITFEHVFQEEEEAAEARSTNSANRLDSVVAPQAESISLPVSTSGGRFSAHSEERQSILTQRKAALIELHRSSNNYASKTYRLTKFGKLEKRKRYIASPRGADLRACDEDLSALDAEHSATRLRSKQQLE
uniref:CUE domain-containing protein n=1 Tax=Syphacia muris TaxID=451379 RepID=A0A0N5AHV8_9BILA